jgi:phospholipid/cholesterol/gamma-HCH transport system substrate-binding protein
METRANYTLIGLFTLLVVGAAFGFVYWFASTAANGEKMGFRIIFTGSVSGLSRGSVVRFNGLRVGEVVEISLVPDDPSRVQALVDLDPMTPVKADTRARLEYQGLTGQASIQLTGGTNAAPTLRTPDGSRPTIFADRSDFQDLLETVQRLAGRADGIMNRIDKVVADNEGSIGNTLRSVETFAKALSDNSAGISSFLASVGDTSQRISSLATRMEAVAGSVDELLRGVDLRGVNRVINNAEAFSQGLADNRRNIDSILTDSATLVKRLSDATEGLDGTLAEVRRLTRAIDAEKVGATVENLERFTATLGGNSGEVERALKNAAQITDRLAVASESLNRVLVAAENFLGTNRPEGQGMFAEFSETAKSFRSLAQNLDKRAAEITAGINRLTGSGTREIEGLVTDTRRAVNELNRTVRSIGRDPSQVITGGRSSIPEYRAN